MVAQFGYNRMICFNFHGAQWYYVSQMLCDLIFERQLAATHYNIMLCWSCKQTVCYQYCACISCKYSVVSQRQKYTHHDGRCSFSAFIIVSFLSLHR